MTRPLRSVLIGDVDYYPSEYAFGVNQAMTSHGHWHTSVNIRWDMGVIAKRVEEMRPDVIWGHMLLWAPGQNKTVDLLVACEQWRQKWGTKVLLHDGDARSETRFPADIHTAVDLALCNHKADRSAWKIPQLYWPYFAFDQSSIAMPEKIFECDLLFAGRLDGGPLYQKRTEMVLQLKEKLGDRMLIFPSPEIQHTLYSTAVIAASAGAVLGYGRPDRNGWLDVRVFQYPGAGGVLLHDDVGDFLQNGIHYLRYESGNVNQVLSLVENLRGMPEVAQVLRATAFQYVQRHHSASARVKQALEKVGLIL